jgi:hypothetical protein
MISAMHYKNEVVDYSNGKRISQQNLAVLTRISTLSSAVHPAASQPQIRLAVLVSLQKAKREQHLGFQRGPPP